MAGLPLKKPTQSAVISRQGDKEAREEGRQAEKGDGEIVEIKQNNVQKVKTGDLY